VAKYIKPDSYGLIFGFNLFVSLLVISIITLLFIQGLIVVIGTKNQVRQSVNDKFTFIPIYLSFIITYINKINNLLFLDTNCFYVVCFNVYFICIHGY